VSLPGSLPSVDVTEAERRLREDPARPVLLDVREPNEFVQVRAPGAMLLPTSVFVARLHELPADRPLLVICHMGNRSAAVVGYLARTGRLDAVNVIGGMDAWAKAGLPTRHGPLEWGEGDLSAG
jgi:rhodanese-related sulfurtransferase